MVNQSLINVNQWYNDGPLQINTDLPQIGKYLL